MNKLDIIQYPDPVLEQECEVVEDVSEYSQLAQDMLYTLKQTGNGVGIAAPQVGVPIRLMVLNTSKGEFIMFNPEIANHSKGTMMSLEGCLSFAEGQLECEVPRWKWVAVVFTNEKGERVRRKLFDLEARCVQHELDHLNGITLADRVPQFGEFVQDVVAKGEASRQAELDASGSKNPLLSTSD